MSEPAADEPLDFERAQFDAPPPAPTCHRCQQRLTTRYFSVNGQAVCAPCLSRAQKEQRSSFPKALLLGSAAGVLGALLSYSFGQLIGDLIMILIGIAVGIAVRAGAGGSRSPSYRVLAIVIAWIAICAVYVPDIALPPVLALLFSLGAPYFLIANGKLLKGLMFAFGLVAAFLLSAPRPFIVEGPFEPSTAKP